MNYCTTKPQVKQRLNTSKDVKLLRFSVPRLTAHARYKNKQHSKIVFSLFSNHFLEHCSAVRPHCEQI